MEAFMRYQRQMTYIIVVAGLAVAAGLWLYAHPTPWYGGRWVNGYLVGLLAGVAVLRLVDVPAVLASVTQAPRDAGKMYFVKMIKSLILYGAALTVAFTTRTWFEPWGVLLGLVTPKAVLVVDTILRPNLFAPPPETGAASPAAPAPEEEDDDDDRDERDGA